MEERELREYAEAVTAYDIAIANDEQDVVSYVYRGESEILMGSIEASLRDFEEVLRIGEEGGNPQLEPWVKRSKLLLGIHKRS